MGKEVGCNPGFANLRLRLGRPRLGLGDGKSGCW